MRKFLVFCAVLTGFSPATVFAQSAAGPRDGTNDVRSESIGTPGSRTDPMDQYLTQRAMNNLPTQKASAAKLGRSRPAKAAEITLGAIVNDNNGVVVAKVDKVEPDGVILSTGTSKVKVPADALGHNNAGLLVDMTKAQFDQVVAKANAAS